MALSRDTGNQSATGKSLKTLTPEDRQLAVVNNGFAYSRSFYSNRFLKFRTWMRLFHRIPDTKPPYRSNIFVPLVYPLVMTVLPRMISNKPTFRFEPREESDEKAVEQMGTLVDYQLDHMQFFKKLKMWVKDVLLFGTGVVKVYWERDDREDYNDPQVQVVDLLDFFPDPKATQVDGGDFMIHRTIMPVTTLKRAKKSDGTPLYKNLDKIKDGTNEENSNKLYLTNDRSMTIGDIDGKLILGTPYRQSMTLQCEVLEYWGIYGDEDEEWVITVANRNTVIRAEKNPYEGKRPFVKMNIDPNNFLFHGTGIIEPLEHLQVALNDTRNQRMDNVNLILNKIFVVLKDADVNEQELISRPGGVMYEGTPGGIRILETPDITNSAYQEEAIIKQDAQEAVGVSDIIQGQLQDANNNSKVEGNIMNTTAKGAQIAVEQAGSRFKYYMQNIEDALVEFGEKLYEYNQLFMSEEKVIRVEAPNDYKEIQKQGLIDKIKGFIPGLQPGEPPKFQWQKINPDSLKNLDLDVKVESGSTQPVEESLKQQKVMNLIGMLAQLPVITPETYLVMAEEILTAYATPNKDKILKTLKIPESQPPKASVSVSLKGDLNPFQSADIAKQVGASPESTDPSLTANLMAKQQHDEIATKLVEHGAKGVIQSQLNQEQAQQQMMQQALSTQNEQANRPTAQG